MTFEIHLKGGSVVTFNATEITTKRDGLGNLTSFSWTTPPGKNVRKLHSVELDQVAAIVKVKD